MASLSALTTDGAQGEAVREWRCVQCGRIIAQVVLHAGTIVIRCKHCGYLNMLEKPAA